MTSTFLVEVEVTSDDMAGLLQDAEDMQQNLEAAGWPVNSVKPWSRQQTLPTVTPIQLQYPTQPPTISPEQ